MSGQKPEILESLLKRRWNMAVLAELERSRGAKFVTLLKRLKLGRASLTVTLRDLVTKGLVRRNAGYGHPLRPEYLLTKKGSELAGRCQELVCMFRDQGVEKIAYAKWSLPLLLAVDRGPARFNALRGMLGGITPRAQTLALKSLEQVGWIQRQINHGYPPIVTYEVSEEGRRIQAQLERLCGR